MATVKDRERDWVTEKDVREACEARAKARWQQLRVTAQEDAKVFWYKLEQSDSLEFLDGWVDGVLRIPFPFPSRGSSDGRIMFIEEINKLFGLFNAPFSAREGKDISPRRVEITPTS